MSQRFPDAFTTSMAHRWFESSLGTLLWFFARQNFTEQQSGDTLTNLFKRESLHRTSYLYGVICGPASTLRLGVMRGPA
jgi:hypothetical protein